MFSCFMSIIIISSRRIEMIFLFLAASGERMRTCRSRCPFSWHSRALALQALLLHLALSPAGCFVVPFRSARSQSPLPRPLSERAFLVPTPLCCAVSAPPPAKRSKQSSFLPILRRTHRLSDSRRGAYSEEGGEAVSSLETSSNPLLQETKRSLQRVSWLSWWCQVILTTVSSVILLFARNVVIQQQAGAAATAASLASPRLFLSTAGLVASTLSIIWTWGNGRRLSRRMVRKSTTAVQAATLLRRAIRIGCVLNLAGMLLHLLAAEQIVGALAIKVLTMPSLSRSAAAGLLLGGGADGGLQPLDILIVQANTNSLLSHFCSLVLLLYLVDQLHKLDPPSTATATRGENRD